LEYFPRGEYITAAEILQMLRDKNESGISIDLPWQIRGILTDLHKRDVLLYNPYIAAYKRIDWR
jgi:hypothetical protein